MLDGISPHTFTENVNCVPLTEFQVFGALRSVVIQCHHLIENGSVGQRVLRLERIEKTVNNKHNNIFNIL